MSARENLSKLALPTDIGNEELVLSHRQKVIQEKLIKCYAEEIASGINQLVADNCNGCIIDHPSQRQHSCLMMESDERLSLYFDDALSKVSEASVMENFMNSLGDIRPRVNGLELLKYILVMTGELCFVQTRDGCLNKRLLNNCNIIFS